jgi:hypothetical protein
MIGDFCVPENWAAGSSPLNSTCELLVTSSNFDDHMAQTCLTGGYLTPLRASHELFTGSCTIKCAEFNKETMKFTSLFLITLRHAPGTSKKLKIHEFCEHDIVMKKVAVDPLLLAD